MRETIRQRPLVLLALLATLILTSGCSSNSEPSPTPSGNVPKETIPVEDIVAEIGDVSITRQQLMDRLLSEYGNQTLRSMMLIEAVNKEAEAFGITVTDDELNQEINILMQGYEDEEQFYKAMREQLNMDQRDIREDARYRLLLEKLSIRDVGVTPSEIDQYLEEHHQEYEPQKQFQIAQIVVETKEEADELLSQLTDGADFGELARMHSVDEFTADEGGALGWIEENDPFEAPEVLQAVVSMQVGEVKGPLEVELGHAIIKLDGRKVLGTKTEEEIRLEVRRQIALGKAVSMRELEQMLLNKYKATIKVSTLER